MRNPNGLIRPTNRDLTQPAQGQLALGIATRGNLVVIRWGFNGQVITSEITADQARQIRDKLDVAADAADPPWEPSGEGYDDLLETAKAAVAPRVWSDHLEKMVPCAE